MGFCFFCCKQTGIGFRFTFSHNCEFKSAQIKLQGSIVNSNEQFWRDGVIKREANG